MFNPHKRLTADQALQHPYVAQFHSAADEPACNRIIVLPISDNTKYTVAEYRWGLWAASHPVRPQRPCSAGRKAHERQPSDRRASAARVHGVHLGYLPHVSSAKGVGAPRG